MNGILMRYFSIGYGSHDVSEVIGYFIANVAKKNRLYTPTKDSFKSSLTFFVRQELPNELKIRMSMKIKMNRVMRNEKIITKQFSSSVKITTSVLMTLEKFPCSKVI